MFGKKPGVCHLTSLDDPRWDVTIECEHVSTAGIPEVGEMVERLTDALGEPPEDLVMDCMKY